MMLEVKATLLCVLVVLAVACLGLQPGEFKITVRQLQQDQKPIDFVLFFNNSGPNGFNFEPVVWAVGALSKAPSSLQTILRGHYMGISASVTVGDEVYQEGPIIALNGSYM